MAIGNVLHGSVPSPCRSGGPGCEELRVSRGGLEGPQAVEVTTTTSWSLLQPVGHYYNWGFFKSVTTTTRWLLLQPEITDALVKEHFEIRCMIVCIHIVADSTAFWSVVAVTNLHLRNLAASQSHIVAVNMFFCCW